MDPVLLIPRSRYPAPTWWWDARALAFDNAAEVTSWSDRRQSVAVTPLAGQTGPVMATTGVLGGKAVTASGDVLATAAPLASSLTALSVAVMFQQPGNLTGTLCGAYDTGANKRQWTIQPVANNGYVNVGLSPNGTAATKLYRTANSAIANDTASVLAFTFAAGTLRLYLNGVELTVAASTLIKTTDDACASLYNTPPVTTICSRLNSTAIDDPCSATIKHVGIWNRVLQPRHMKAINAAWRAVA